MFFYIRGHFSRKYLSHHCFPALWFVLQRDVSNQTLTDDTKPEDTQPASSMPNPQQPPKMQMVWTHDAQIQLFHSAGLIVTHVVLTNAPSPDLGTWSMEGTRVTTRYKNTFILKNSGKFPDQEGALYGLQSVWEPVIWCMLHFSSQSFSHKLSLGIFHLCTEEANICLGTLFDLYI